MLAELDDTHLESATVTVGSGYVAGEDILGFNNTATITAIWDPATGQLELTGSDTIAAYQAALRTVTYENVSDDPDANSRTIAFVVNDGERDSNILLRSIDLTPVNDPPQQSGIESAVLGLSLIHI